MHISNPRTLCVVPDTPARRQFGGPEAVVIVVVIIMTAALTARGMPPTESLLLLWAAGLLAVTLTRLATGSVMPTLGRLAGPQPIFPAR